MCSIQPLSPSYLHEWALFLSHSFTNQSSQPAGVEYKLKSSNWNWSLMYSSSGWPEIKEGYLNVEVISSSKKVDKAFR